MRKDNFFSILEKILLVPAILLLITVIIYNSLEMVNIQQKTVLLGNRQEYNLQALVSPYGEITISIDGNANYPQLELMINGLVAKKFNEDNSVTVSVRDGDLVQVNASMYQETIDIRLDEASNNIRIPNLHATWTLNSNIVVLSTIRIQ
ncbi:hypothetical protein [Alkaliphilus transvaalensis]|uniref:hypothetical protein n=1 Tax=Alkaliphilus transvaalensis TaxID=114628 RepID=UPI000479027B|nr:hypothetical protein [Alkaliphilus transvaalensis]